LCDAGRPRIALDRKTGSVVWDVHAAEHRRATASRWLRLASRSRIAGVSEASTESADSSMLTDARRANANGGSTQFPVGRARPRNLGGDSWKVGGSPAWITGTYRSRDEHDVLDNGKPFALEPRRRRRATSLQQLSAGTRSGHGKLKWHFQFTRRRT